MLSYLKSLQPSSIILFLCVFFIVKMPLLLVNTTEIVPIPNFWGSIGAFGQGSFILNSLPLQICLLAQAIWFNNLFHKADFHEGSSMIPALYFTLVTSLLPQFNVLSIYTIITFILLLLFQTYLTISTQENSRVECFNVGMLGGVLCLLSVHFIAFIPFLFLILLSIKSFRFNEYILLLFGLLFSVYIALSISYLFDMFLNISAVNFGIFDIQQLNDSLLDVIVLIVSAAYLFFSFISMRGILYSTGVKRKKNIRILIFLFIGMLLVITLSPSLDNSILSLLFIPISIFLSLLMLRIRKKRLGEILNGIFIGIIFVVNIIRCFH